VSVVGKLVAAVGAVVVVQKRCRTRSWELHSPRVWARWWGVAGESQRRGTLRMAHHLPRRSWIVGGAAGWEPVVGVCEGGGGCCPIFGAGEE
jgi:hypothetical protein